jgi:ketosteroid isomerase-like protein
VVSQQNVEIVRRSIEAFNRRDIDAALQDAVPEVTLDWSRSRGLDAGVYVGWDAIRRFWTEIFAAFERLTLIPDDFIVDGEQVMVPNTALITGRGEIEVAVRSVSVATLREGKLLRWEMYQDRTEARDAVELKEQPVSQENLHLVRSIFADWERGDFSRTEWADPQIEMTRPDAFEGGAAKGLGSTGDAWRTWLTTWRDYRAVASEFRVLDDERILVLGRMHGRAVG